MLASTACLVFYEAVRGKGAFQFARYYLVQKMNFLNHREPHSRMVTDSELKSSESVMFLPQILKQKFYDAERFTVFNINGV